MFLAPMGEVRAQLELMRGLPELWLRPATDGRHAYPSAEENSRLKAG